MYNEVAEHSSLVVHRNSIKFVDVCALFSIYGSVSAGREIWLFRVTFFVYGEPSCGQTIQNRIDFSIDFG